jgi:hypothetical protein
VNGKQCREARAKAYEEAGRRKLWKKGEEGVYAKWWRKLLARIFPKLRKKYTDAIGRWYKATLKIWAKNIRASLHDRELAKILRVRNQLERKRRIERIKKAGGSNGR